MTAHTVKSCILAPFKQKVEIFLVFSQKSVLYLSDGKQKLFNPNCKNHILLKTIQETCCGGTAGEISMQHILTLFPERQRKLLSVSYPFTVYEHAHTGRRVEVSCCGGPRLHSQKRTGAGTRLTMSAC